MMATAAEVEAVAQALYDACPTVKPAWEQCGDVTRSVWLERALERLESEELW